MNLKNLATKYNGELYNFKDIRVVSAGIRDADAEGVEGMSASKMRKAVVDGNFKAFKSGTPKNIKDDDVQSIFNAGKIWYEVDINLGYGRSLF